MDRSITKNKSKIIRLIISRLKQQHDYNLHYQTNKRMILEKDKNNTVIFFLLHPAMLALKSIESPIAN